MSTILVERDYLLDELGDPDAPVGSRLWSLYMHHAIRRDLYETNQSEQRLYYLVKSFKTEEAWTQLGYSTWEEYCRKRLNSESNLVETKAMMLAKDAKPLNGHGGDRKSMNQYYDGNVDSSKQQGNSVDYLTRRIARDRPDILERMQAGEFKSVRQAAIEAGIISPKKRNDARLHIYADDPVATAHYLAQHVDAEWMQIVCEEYFRIKQEE